jgi:hypothetical protein
MRANRETNMQLVTPKPTTEHRPLEWFKPDEKELARHDDPAKIRQLGEDMQANGQLQAVAATEVGQPLPSPNSNVKGESWEAWICVSS